MEKVVMSSSEPSKIVTGWQILVYTFYPNSTSLSWILSSTNICCTYTLYNIKVYVWGSLPSIGVIWVRAVSEDSRCLIWNSWNNRGNEGIQTSTNRISMLRSICYTTTTFIGCIGTNDPPWSNNTAADDILCELHHAKCFFNSVYILPLRSENHGSRVRSTTRHRNFVGNMGTMDCVRCLGRTV